MISKEKLYSATEDGLRIFEIHLPHIREYIGSKKPFKLRKEERTPSASIKKYKTKEGYDVWQITDFGGDGRAINPIQYHIDQTGMTFSEAILDLASRFNICDELNRTVNKPDIRKRPAEAEEIEGSCVWDIDQEFTSGECEIMGPRVTPDHLKALNWYRVKSITNIKNREAITKYSNKHYPIFMRECWFEENGERKRFYKVYEPLNHEKRFRFQYQPAGQKPRYYTNGLDELKAAYVEYNEREEVKWLSDPLTAEKPYKEKKLAEAIICSGERDAICARSFGYFPVWFNSETYAISEAEIREIMRYVETLYNIPDIDDTGKRKGRELALKYIDIHTVWLPEKLKEYKDSRGNPCKDLRDWCKYNKDIRSFKNLLEMGLPAKFWTTSYKKDGEIKYGIKRSSLINFLELNKFYIYDCPEESDKIKFIRINNNIVSEVSTRVVRKFIFDWIKETAQPITLLDYLLGCADLNALSLENLKDIKPNFCSFTAHSQFFFFSDYAVEVKAKEIIRYDKTEQLDRYCWDHNSIKHNIKIIEDKFFEVTRKDDTYDSDAFDIIIHNTRSNFFKYLINSSRLYWRKELEEYADTLGENEAEQYRREHKFDISGEGLTPEEIQEQKRCLISKIFMIGYMLHRYKIRSKAWCPFLMDNLVGTGDQCNGGSGKSFMFNAIAQISNVLQLNGRNEKLMANNFWLERVTSDTDIIYLDDAAEYFPLKEMYGLITSDLTINPKNVKSFQLGFYDAPKFAISTNYVPREFEPSTVRRLLFCVTSDYYHNASEATRENDYRESRGIRDDFGMDLMDSRYPEKEWEADINFMFQCLQFYLSFAHTPAKIEPKIDNIIYRKYLRDMSDNFKDWAEAYFAPDSGNLNDYVVRETAFEDYKRSSGASKTTMKSFTKSLKAFCYTCEYIEELNPEDLCNSGGCRILKRIVDDNGQKKQTEMIYIRTKPEYRQETPGRSADTISDLFPDDDPFKDM